MATLTPEQRSAVATLRQSDLISKVVINYYHIYVHFKDGLTERWALRKRRKNSRGRLYIPRSDLFIRPVPTYFEYETKPLDHARNKLIEQHFAIQIDDLKQGGFADIRLKIHETIIKLQTEGWINPAYPTDALEEDWQNLENKPWEGHAPNLNMVNTQGVATPGFITAIHHMKDAGSTITGRRIPLKEAWYYSLLMKKAVEKCIRKRRDITRTSIIRALCTKVHYRERYAGFRFISPLFYKAMFTKVLKINNPRILDFAPDTGGALMGMAMLKGSYFYKNVGDFGYQAEGLGRHLNVKVGEDDGRMTADVGMVGFRSYSVDDAINLVKQYKPRCNSLLIPMTPWDGAELKQKLPPRRIINARLDARQQKICDLLFVY